MYIGNTDRKNQRKVLKLARKMIDSPVKWTKYVCARTKRGEECGSWDENAYQFCAVGALRAASYRLWGEECRIGSEARVIMDSVNKDAEWASIPVWNDSRETTYDDVIAVFDAALEATKKKRKDA